MNTDTTEASQPTGRREFLDVLIGLSGLAGVLVAFNAILSYLRPPALKPRGQTEAVEVGDASDIPVGQGKVVQVDATPVLVIRTEERLVAFSAVCTHLGCIVAWDPERKQIHCPCHAGVFDINGNVVSGPPPRPLPPYQVEEVGGKIMVRSA